MLLEHDKIYMRDVHSANDSLESKIHSVDQKLNLKLDVGLEEEHTSGLSLK